MANEIFQEQLDIALNAYSDKTAIECGSSQVSYRQLLTRSKKIAAMLNDEYVTVKGKFIGLLSADRSEIISAITGISRAGGVFVPLDTNFPGARIMQMVDTIGLRAIITSREQLQLTGLSKEFHDAGITLFFLEDITALDTDIDNPVVSTSPDDPLYIYFTSGSTGIPKAIVGKNKSLLNFINWEIGEFQLSTGGRFSQFITPGFDAFLRDVYVPLFSGGTICIPPDTKAIFNETEMTRWLNEARIQYIHCVPSVFRLINNHDIDNNSFPHLQYVFLSGEKIVVSDLKNWFQQSGERIQLVNFYGTTETTLISSFYRIVPADVSRESIPVGKPITGAELKILTNELRPVDAMQAGDLYIATAYPTLGYLNDPALNEQKFIEELQRPGIVLFKTGDKAKELPNGDIELLGRIDRQIKLRGMRVAPEEIEQLLLKLTEVKDAVVDAVEINDAQVLSAFLVLRSDESEDQVKEKIEWQLRTSLPEYMVPSRFVLLDELPRRVNGKINYSELKKYVLQEANKAAPVSKEEVQLFQIWSAIIRTDNFGIRDTFFEVGGNSFHLISLVAKVHSAFKIRLSIQEIFLHNTIEKLAVFLASKTENKEVVLSVAPTVASYPLTAGQFQVFQLQQLQPDSITYNLPQFFILEGNVDVKKLQAAFHELSVIHPMLRTGFRIENDEPVQFIADTVTVDVTYKNAPPWTDAEELKYLQQFVKPFDLSKPSLLRAEILRKSDERYLLLIDVHHIIADGVSQKILNRDLLDLYNGKAIVASELQYRDFAFWQHKERTTGGFERQQRYWLARLAAPPSLIPLPTDYSSYDPANTEGAVFDAELSEKESRSVMKLVQEKQVTLFAFFLSVYYILLSKLSGQRDLIVGTAAGARRFQSLEQVVGMFINVLALRSQVNPAQAFSDFLKQVQQHSIEALENQDLPFEEVVKQLRLPRSRRNPLFNVMIIFQNMNTEHGKHPDFSTEAYPFVQQTSKFDLTLFVKEVDKKIHFRMEYSSQLFYEEQVARFMRYFSEIITTLLDDPTVEIGNIFLSHDLEEAIGGDEKIEFNF